MSILNPSVVEIVSSLLALVGLAALAHGRRWGWLVAALSSLGYVFFTWKLGLFGQMLLNGVYVVAQLAGWAGWAQGDFFWRRYWWLWLLPAWPLGALMQVQLGLVDGWLTAFCLCAQAMTSARVAQVWRCWLLLDLAAAGLYASRSAWLTCLLYLLFAAIAESAHRWWRTAGAGQGTEKEPPYASQ